MQTKIYCKKSHYKNQHYFYARIEGTDYYLFSQKMYRGVENRYSKGIDLNKALDRSYNDYAVRRTAERLLSNLKKKEKEIGVFFLNKNAKKQSREAYAG